MPTKHFTDNNLSTMANICDVAAERFKENAKEFRKLAMIDTPSEGALFPTGQSAERLAEQFDRQAAEAREMAAIFREGEPFAISYAIEDEETV